MSGTEDDNDAAFTDDEPESYMIFRLSISGQITENLSYTLGVNNVTGTIAYDPYFKSSKYRNIERQDKNIWFSPTKVL